MSTYDPEAKRAYYLANREKRLAYQMEWNNANKDKAKINSDKWRAENRENERLRALEFRRHNPQLAKQIHLNYRNRNRDKINARDARRRKDRPELSRLYASKRRARKIAAGGSHTIEDIEKLLRVQKHRCANPRCRKSIRKKYHVDHVIPLARGGSDDKTNLQLLCIPCNLIKGAKDPIVWAQQNGMLL